MRQDSSPRWEARARIMKALAHPTRLVILDLLREGEQCVQDLHEHIDADLSTVSKHLSVLKGEGVVAVERRGNRIFYSLRVPCILDFLGCVDRVLLANAEAHRELAP